MLSPRKFVFRLLLPLVVLAVVVLVILVMNLSKVVRVGVEQGGTMVLGVPTQLESADVSLLGGSLGLNGLSLGSPEGFEADEMLHLGHMRVKIKIMSVMSEEIVIREIVVDGAEVTLEFADGKTNWGVLMDALESEPDEEEKEMKNVRIDRVSFTNGKLRIIGIPLIGSATAPLPSVDIPEIRTADGTGVTVRKALVAVVASLGEAITSAVEDVIPSEKLGEMTKELGSIKEAAGGLLEEVGRPKDLIGGILGGREDEDEE